MRTFTISEALLDELKDYFDNRQDVRDGSYGEPVANEEMFLLMRLEEECRPIAAPQAGNPGSGTPTLVSSPAVAASESAATRSAEG
jgi:hypothetical protein